MIGHEANGHTTTRDPAAGRSLPTVMTPSAVSDLPGLSEAEVVELRKQGQGNLVRLPTSRSYAQILRENAFTSINTVLFAIGTVLLLMDRPADALVSAGLVLFNVVIGVVQEGRAKRTLDRIALLTRPRATVVREGKERAVDPAEIVRGDVLVARPGDQILVDGAVRSHGPAELDESLLTGESDPIPKEYGDRVNSGSFCVSGAVTYVAEQVGTASLSYQMASAARAFRQVHTPLQRSMAAIVRVLALLVLNLTILFTLSLLLTPMPLVELLLIAAVLTTLIPQGLFAMTTVTYGLGIVRLAGKGVLIQQMNAVESLSNVDVVCMDKTGTLTTNALELEALRPIGIAEDELGALLGDYAASASGGNRTLAAIGAALKGTRRAVRTEVPFASERMWSAIAFDDPDLPGTYILGAPEVLRPYLQPGDTLEGQVAAWIAEGRRVVLFARQPAPVRPLPLAAGSSPQLSAGLVPLGILCIRDQLRPDVDTIIRHFADAHVQLKIISGDNPETVAALARQAGFAPPITAISGREIQGMDEAELERLVENTQVFGRIAPQQKGQLVRALQRRGHYVAMIGDGLNDVLSLKQAQLAIGLQGGSQAARSVADMVLLEDSFAVLPAALCEGQRIVNAMHDVVCLLLSRTLYFALLILGAAIVGVTFPLTPVYVAIPTVLTVGIPTILLAVWARPGHTRLSLAQAILHFVVPAGAVLGAVSLAVYLYYFLGRGDLDLARTALTSVMVLCGLLLLVLVEPPMRALAGGDEFSGDWRPTILAGVLLALYAAAVLIPGLRDALGLEALGPGDLLILVGASVGGSLLLLLAWRLAAVERLLGLSPEAGAPAPPSEAE